MRAARITKGEKKRKKRFPTLTFALESKSRVRTMERELCERDRQRRADLETQKNDVSGGGRFRLALLIASG